MTTRILFRVLCGALIGPLLFLLFGWRLVLNILASDRLPVQHFALASLIGAVLLGLTTPGLPWRPRE